MKGNSDRLIFNSEHIVMQYKELCDFLFPVTPLAFQFVTEV